MTNQIDDATCVDYNSHRPSTHHSKDECPTEIKAGRDEATRKVYARIAHETYIRDLDRIAERLNDLISRMKREATPIEPIEPIEGRSLPSDAYPHSYAANRAIHELHWGIANAHLDTLIKSAAEADKAARDARQGRES